MAGVWLVNLTVLRREDQGGLYTSFPEALGSSGHLETSSEWG